MSYVRQAFNLCVRVAQEYRGLPEEKYEFTLSIELINHNINHPSGVEVEYMSHKRRPTLGYRTSRRVAHQRAKGHFPVRYVCPWQTWVSVIVTTTDDNTCVDTQTITPLHKWRQMQVSSQHNDVCITSRLPVSRSPQRYATVSVPRKRDVGATAD